MRKKVFLLILDADALDALEARSREATGGNVTALEVLAKYALPSRLDDSEVEILPLQRCGEVGTTETRRQQTLVALRCARASLRCICENGGKWTGADVEALRLVVEAVKAEEEVRS